MNHQRSKIPNLPFEVSISKKKHLAAYEWCRDKWGDNWSITENKTGIWAAFWEGHRSGGNYRYIFEHKEHALIFALTWV